MAQKLWAEGLGTALLLIAIIGSGIMGESLAGGNVAVALLANAIATGCMLYVIISVLGPISGAHFNPAVTFVFWMRGDIENRLAVAYVPVQIAAGIVGVWATHAMFDMPVFQTSTTMHRTGFSQWWSEAIATFGMLFVIVGGRMARPQIVPALVAVYITGAYWFTASTSFANPAVTIARGFSDTFAGIYPGHIFAFVTVQLASAWVAHRIFRVLFPPPP